MATLDKIDIFTQAARTEFINGFTRTGEMPPMEKVIATIPSTARIENYAWMYPPAGFARWDGYRRLAKIGTLNYRVPNLTFSSGFEIAKEDWDDDQTGGYTLQAAALGEKARDFHIIQASQVLAAGQTTLCFDGSNFFAATHNIGGYPTGGNIITATTVASDTTHAMVAMVMTNKVVKPLLWQNREPPDLRTNVGDNNADFIRLYKWWADLRGQCAFGYWWDAILVKFTGTPTVPEMQTALGQVNQRFRQFLIPKNLASDPNEYVHGQVEFNDKSLALVHSTGIDHIVRQALTLSLIGSTENWFKGFATQIVNGYLDGVT